MAKAIRKEKVFTEINGINYGMETSEKMEFLEELRKEAGDILWQLSGLCTVMGWNLEEVAQQNLEKLASRKARNKIDGDGDNR
ncbi:MAG: hypothetical protein IKH15_12095 [Bacteroidales bacterium]|nr:hypothetical protein [Bacteroidales bacterium]